MKKSGLSILTLLVGLFLQPVLHAQFLHADGKYIADGNGNRMILRGIGLGGWMLQEGYMLETSSFAGTQHEIRAKIEALVGAQNTSLFYQSWLQNHCTRADVDSLASWGFNSIRLPMHYNLFTLPIQKEPVHGQDTWIETGFKMVDSILDWCGDNQMYLILDLHAAPGGQGKDANISDYDPGLPSLWESSENRRKTVALWRKLAERYSNEPWMGGYDLINEPNWAFKGANPNGCDETDNKEIRGLYIRITDTVRMVDNHHMIFIEGNCWGGNFSGILPPWDNNMAVSFHKYWNATDLSSIISFINLRNQYNIPLWMGESGENSNQWFYETIRLLEENQIGWSWWPLKKINSVVGPLTVIKTPEYQSLLNYWQGSGPKPSVQDAIDALLQITENLKIGTCLFHPDVIDAMFRQQVTDSTIPFTKHEIPGRVYSVDYDLGRAEKAYHDVVDKNTGGPGASAWNVGWAYRNDGVDIEKSMDIQNTAGYHVGWTEDDEWMQYTIEILETGAYQLRIRVASASAIGRIRMEVNGLPLAINVSVSPTGGWNTWKDVLINDVVLYQGMNKLKVIIEKSGMNLGFLEFGNRKQISDIATTLVEATTDWEGQKIILSINKKLDQSIQPQVSDFSLTINGGPTSITGVTYKEAEPQQIELSCAAGIQFQDEVRLTYSGQTIMAEDGVKLAMFTSRLVKNQTRKSFTIPGKIEAEDYLVNQGWISENCSDAGGGYDMGYTDVGDYMEYYISVSSSDDYTFQYRIASNDPTGGSFTLFRTGSQDQPVLLHTLFPPYTHGWQSWENISGNAFLPSGKYVLRLVVNNSSFNLNWMNILLASDISESLPDGPFKVFPNPAHDAITIETGKHAECISCMIIDMQGRTMLRQELPRYQDSYIIPLVGLLPGLYMLRLMSGVKSWSRLLSIF
jgi:endoglucanase